MSEETKLGEKPDGSGDNLCSDSGRYSDSSTESYNDGHDNAIFLTRCNGCNSNNDGCQNNSGDNGRHNNNNHGSGDINNGSHNGGKTGVNDGCVSSNDIFGGVREGSDINSDEDKEGRNSTKEVLAEINELANMFTRVSMEKDSIIKQLQRRVRKQAESKERLTVTLVTAYIRIEAASLKLSKLINRLRIAQNQLPGAFEEMQVALRICEQLDKLLADEYCSSDSEGQREDNHEAPCTAPPLAMGENRRGQENAVQSGALTKRRFKRQTWTNQASQYGRGNSRNNSQAGLSPSLMRAQSPNLQTPLSAQGQLTETQRHGENGGDDEETLANGSVQNE